MSTKAESVPSTGDGDDEDTISRKLRERGYPVTREHRIDYNWVELPAPWTAEHEAELPPHPQEWSIFER